MKRRFLSYLFFAVLVSVGLAGCIEDGFTSSPSDQPAFSTDTLNLGTIFTDQSSTTHRFIVYNRASKSLNISNISISGENASLFRLNVDGFSGTRFSDVEIRANDSIFIFVEATLPPNGATKPIAVEASLDFLTNGLTRSVVLAASGRDVVRLKAHEISESTALSAERPYQIFDSLVVAEGATLTIPAGAELFFHDGARLVVHGSLRSLGECGKEVTLCGDRTGNVVADISFDIMSRQWRGVVFSPSSDDNYLSHTRICNTVEGVDCSAPLTLVNSRLRNSGSSVLVMRDAPLRAYGCEFAESGASTLVLDGGEHLLNHCTLSNYYLFSAITGPLIEFTEDDNKQLKASATVANTILYGLGKDLSHGDFAGLPVSFDRCLFKSEGKDDDNFLSCVWGKDPLFLTIRSEYIFDYRLKPESPAIGAAEAALTAAESAVDRLGRARGANPDIGAYVFNPEDSEQ